MRNIFADTFYELGKADPRLAIVVADISPAGSIARFREEFPDRFVNTGVSEQIMIGMCAGMALRGLRPFAYTIATFTLFRPYEFVRVDLCYHNLPVTIVGIGGGVTYSTLGSTHHALEDVSIACAIPNMAVVAPCDPRETREATLWCAQTAARAGLSAPRQGRRAGFHQGCAGTLAVRQDPPTAPRAQRRHPVLRAGHQARLRRRRAVSRAGAGGRDLFGAHLEAARP